MFKLLFMCRFNRLTRIPFVSLSIPSVLSGFHLLLLKVMVNSKNVFLFLSPFYPPVNRSDAMPKPLESQTHPPVNTSSENAI